MGKIQNSNIIINVKFSGFGLSNIGKNCHIKSV